MKYYEINEQSAKTAKEINSFSNYVTGSATESYKEQIDYIYNLGEQAKARVSSDRFEHIDNLLDRYARKYAEHLNKGFRIESYCPSIMVCGAGNFPTRKKEKQNSMRDRHYANYEYFENLENKIRNFGTKSEIVLSSDPFALEKLEQELQDLKEKQEKYKSINTYYRKNKTLKGYEDFDDEKAEQLDLKIADSLHKVPFAPYKLTNNNASIKRLEGRITELTRLKETVKEYESSVCEVTEDKGDMRIRLVFDGKPTAKVREVLKKNAFKWSPKNEAWQRQLTDNARVATKRVLKEIEVL